MRRLFGIALLVLGLAPMAVLFGFAAWVSRMYVVGLWMDARAVVTLVAAAIISLACIGGGFYLLRRPRKISN